MTSKQSVFYRPELDVLRFFAFLSVFIYHSLHFSNLIFDSFRLAGALGVCLFFLLSAYLITELLDREKKQSGAIHLRAFYIRRVLRIWPLYFAILFLDYFVHRHSNPHAFSTSRLIAFLLLAGNWYVAHYGWTSTLSAPLWSIPVEEQFYILWPSISKYFDRIGSILFSLAMIPLSYIVLFHLARAYPSGVGDSLLTSIWPNSFVQFQFFSSGALISLVLRGRTPNFHLFTRLGMLTTGVAILGTAQIFFPLISKPSVGELRAIPLGYLGANIGCVLIFLSFLGESRFGRPRLLVYLGKISYGLYVFHWMMLHASALLVARLPRLPLSAAFMANAMQPALALLLTIFVASLSYRFFEAPILRYKNRFEFIKTRAV